MQAQDCKVKWRYQVGGNVDATKSIQDRLIFFLSDDRGLCDICWKAIKTMRSTSTRCIKKIFKYFQ